MGRDKYKVDSGEDHLTYTFYSEGPKGKILKIVLYQPVYELYGELEGELERFRPGVDYQSFLIRKVKS